MNRPIRGLAFLALALLAALGACRLPDLDPAALVRAPLAAGEVRADRLTGASLAYPIRLESGEALQVSAEQQGVDVVLVLLDPRGREIVRVDGPTGAHGTEDLVAVAERTGPHRLEVRPFARGASGSFMLRVEALRPATAADRQVAEAQRAAARARRLAASDRAEDRAEAAALYAEAIATWIALERPAAAAEARLARAWLLRADGDLTGALPEFTVAAAAF